MKVQPKTIGIAAVTPSNCYTTSRTEFSWQSDLFLCIASCHKTKSLTAGTIYNTAILIDSALHRCSCAAGSGCQHRFYKILTAHEVYVRLTKQLSLSLLYDWHLLNVRQAKYLFSAMFVGRNSNHDVINALFSKAMMTWKYFLMCMWRVLTIRSITLSIPNIVRPHLSELRLSGITAIHPFNPYTSLSDTDSEI